MNKVFVLLLSGWLDLLKHPQPLFVVFVFVCLFVSYIMMESVCDTLKMS